MASTSESKNGTLLWKVDKSNKALIIEINSALSSGQKINLKNVSNDDVKKIILLFCMEMMRIFDSSISDDKNDPRVARIYPPQSLGSSSEPILSMRLQESTAPAFSNIIGNDLRSFNIIVGTPGSECKHWGFSYDTLHKFLQSGQSVIKDLTQMYESQQHIITFGGGTPSSTDRPQFSFGASSSSPFCPTNE